MGILPSRKEIRVPLQLLLDLRAGARDPRLDGAERHAEHGGDLVVRQAVHISQDDGDPHVVVERLNAVTYQARPLVRLSAFLGIRRRDAKADDVTRLITCLIFVGHDTVSLAAPEMVVTKIRADLEQPGLERRVPQRTDLLPGAQKRLLRDVGGIAGPPRRSVGMVDEGASKAPGRKSVWVRVPPPAVRFWNKGPLAATLRPFHHPRRERNFSVPRPS